MIECIEALNYKCLRYVQRRLQPFHVLVGPNASGKSTFLDVVSFVGDLLREGPEAAVRRRAASFQELVWNREDDRFELALELVIPATVQEGTGNVPYPRCRYAVEVGTVESGEIQVMGEVLSLLPEQGAASSPVRPNPPRLFPEDREAPFDLSPSRSERRGWRDVVKKIPGTGNDYFRSETTGWNNLFRMGPRKAALANLPEDLERFPRATWAKRFLMEDVHALALDNAALRKPCHPAAPRTLQPDGSNLPIPVRELRKKDPNRFQRWLEHVRTVLYDLQDIDVIERPEDRHLYLVAEYASGLRVPMWLLSDGTLRMLALSILAYTRPADDMYLIEEPENSMHPRAVQAVFQSLSSLYQGQRLLSSHSPLILGLAKPEQVLCFARTESGATDVVSGSEHPRLRDWTGQVSLGDLFAAGVLG